MNQNKTNQKKQLKQENGAISTLVLFTVFMFVTILMAVYFGVTTMQKSQLKSDMRIRDIYGQEVERVDQIYEEQLIAGNQKEANEPNISGFNKSSIGYVTWTLNEEGTEYVINDTQTTPPTDWYDYDNGKWANIKTTNETVGLEAYWVWIPRYEYIVPASETATEIEVKFIPLSQREADEGYTIHPTFTNEGNGGFGDLDGIWVAKFEAVSSTPTAENGGGDTTNLKVQVIPNKPSWRNISTNNIFTVCRKMTEEGEVLQGSTVNSHIIKNLEWGACAILSQSKYGIFNPKSSTGDGITENGTAGDGTHQIWNNPSSSYITGAVGVSQDDKTQSSVNAYNTISGIKASTTGTVYGLYDMAGGSFECVAGCISGQEKSLFGVEEGNEQYVDLYTNPENSFTNYDGAKNGDSIKETKRWNDDEANFVNSSWPVFTRGRSL